MAKLGFGCMRLPQNDGIINIAEFSKMADYFLSSGGALFDTAYTYHSGNSETALRKAVVERYPRGAYQVADKMPVWLAKDHHDLINIFSHQQEKTGLAYFDRYLLHNLSPINILQAEKVHAFSFLEDLKGRGLVHEIGFSFHASAMELEQILQLHPEVDFVQLQINYLDWDSPTVQARYCLDIARQNGKKVVVMEPIRGGTLANLPSSAANPLRRVSLLSSNASWALRFAAIQDGVDMVLSGMSSIAQVEDNVRTFSLPMQLTQEELVAIWETRDLLNAIPSIPCTGCGYCTAKCPEDIPIPSLIDIYNEYQRFNDYAYAQRRYRVLTRKFSGTDKCIKCGNCSQLCPQGLSVYQIVARCADLFKDCKND